MAFVVMAPVMSPLVFWVGLVISAVCLFVVMREGGSRRIAGALLMACFLAGPLMVTVHAVPISCEYRCFAIECWWDCLAS